MLLQPPQKKAELSAERSPCHVSYPQHTAYRTANSSVPHDSQGQSEGIVYRSLFVIESHREGNAIGGNPYFRQILSVELIIILHGVRISLYIGQCELLRQIFRAGSSDIQQISVRERQLVDLFQKITASQQIEIKVVQNRLVRSEYDGIRAVTITIFDRFLRNSITL